MKRVKMFSMENFRDWLLNELDKRDWSQSDLAKAAGISRGTLSNILSSSRGVGEKSLISIGRALRIPPEVVFQAAGILPKQPDKNALIQKIEYILQDLSETDQQDVLEYARLRRRISEERGNYTIKKEPE